MSKKRKLSVENLQEQTSRTRTSFLHGRLYPPECIFCDKTEIKVNRKTERCIKFAVFKSSAVGNRVLKHQTWKDIERRALELGLTELHRKVQGEDLFAREACFHASCRNEFNLRYLRHLKETESSSDTNLSKSTAHQIAFDVIVRYIKEEVIGLHKIARLSFLRSLYVQELERIGYPSPEYRSDKLKLRLQDHSVSSSLEFANISDDNGCIRYTIVYNARISLQEAMTQVYRLSSRENSVVVAEELNHDVKSAFKTCKPLPWPPTLEDLDMNLKSMPQSLIKFMTHLMSPDGKGTESEFSRRVVLSLCQDICRAITQGSWKQPKHILLSTTIRHLFRSKKLTAILHRLGHCESYDCIIEMKIALAKALNESSSCLTPRIVTGEENLVFHTEWDNLNKITTNIHGTNIVNSTGGIMIQETKSPDQTSKDRKLPVFKRSTVRSFNTEPRSLPPVTINQRRGPKFPESASYIPPPSNDNMYLKCLEEYKLWSFARVVCTARGKEQTVPGFGGFVSATGVRPAKKSTIDYFTPIHFPFTDYATIKELLKRSEDATKQVGQSYVLTTFDLGGCMKALPLIWKYPERYKDHIITPGPFHTAMNFLGMLTGHKCRGSGYGEILLEAQLTTSGCLRNVVAGKAYAKALFCLKTVCEAMERLLLEQFLEDQEFHITNQAALLRVAQTCTRNTLNASLADDTTKDLLVKYRCFEDKVRSGYLGKTATFWLSVIDQGRLLFMLLYAVKTNNLPLFHKCNSDMANLFFAYDGPNYSRYLAWLEVFLTNIDLSHPGARELLERGGIAVARSFIPGSRSAVDKTMEETFMRFAKSQGGFIGLFSLYGAYERWCCTTSTRTLFYEKILEICGLVVDPDSPKDGRHRELDKAEIRKSEQAVQRTLTAIQSFTNPFTVADKNHLYCLASGSPVSSEVADDVLRAESVGKEAKERFIKDRLAKDPENLFFEPIKKQKLQTMDSSNKVVKLTTSQGKVIQFREQSDIAFTLLVKSQHVTESLNIDELMKYPMTPVPHSLGTADGFLTKTNKASMMHYLLEGIMDAEYPSESLFIQDGNALFHSMKNLPATFRQICLNILDVMVAKKNFIFATDCYHPDSIKGQERLRRGCSPKFVVDGPATRTPADFKLFLTNDDNKVQLCHLLLKVWKSDVAASRLKDIPTAIIIVDGLAHRLSSSNGSVSATEIKELASNQEETDTRVILYLHHAVKLGFKSAVIRSPDTDILLILLHHASSIPLSIFFDTGSGKHRRVIDISTLALKIGQQRCTMLLGLYVFTGEDATSAFKGKGKVGPAKKLESLPEFHDAFRTLGDTWSVNRKTAKAIEAFTCRMNSNRKETSVNALRSIMLRQMVGEDEPLTSKSRVDFSRLPPCQYNLIPHLQRVNHRLAHIKRAGTATYKFPKPHDPGQGWEKTEKGMLEPRWSSGPILPPSLVDLLPDAVESEDYEELIEDEDIDWDDQSDED